MSTERDAGERQLAKQLTITGIVQGVGYRAAFHDAAVALGLSGWVRNRRDGSVEATVRGELQALDAIVDWARRGPAGASVSQVSVSEVGDASVTQSRFEIRPTK
ncbi:MAG TPA: acylphosphatase [Oxalobacteraceae bacterium]|nr:acylphosphatase [Oxalobacteraceae bacterium]